MSGAVTIVLHIGEGGVLGSVAQFQETAQFQEAARCLVPTSSGLLHLTANVAQYVIKQL